MVIGFFESLAAHWDFALLMASVAALAVFSAMRRPWKTLASFAGIAVSVWGLTH